MNFKKISIILSVVGMTMLAHTALAAINDYANYWAFDDAAGRSVGDTGGQNGVLVGSSTGFGWTSGKVGTGLALDGLAGEGVALPDGFLTGGQGTVSVWLKMNELSSQNIIFSAKSTVSDKVYALLSLDLEGRPQFQYRTDSTGADKKVQGARILNKGEWYHFVFVANGQTYKMYINGEELTVTGDNNGRWFSDMAHHTFSYRIGKSEATPLLGTMNGIVDELRIYKRAVTADEIPALYKEGNDGVPTVPVALPPSAVLSISSDHILHGGSVASPQSSDELGAVTFSHNLSVGSRGEDVRRLQSMLITMRLLADGLSTGYFGQLTKAAVIHFQKKHGLPATGFFGPMTRAKINNVE